MEFSTDYTSPLLFFPPYVPSPPSLSAYLITNYFFFSIDYRLWFRRRIVGNRVGPCPLLRRSRISSPVPADCSACRRSSATTRFLSLPRCVLKLCRRTLHLPPAVSSYVSPTSALLSFRSTVFVVKDRHHHCGLSLPLSCYEKAQ